MPSFFILAEYSLFPRQCHVSDIKFIVLSERDKGADTNQ